MNEFDKILQNIAKLQNENIIKTLNDSISRDSPDSKKFSNEDIKSFISKINKYKSLKEKYTKYESSYNINYKKYFENYDKIFMDRLKVFNLENFNPTNIYYGHVVDPIRDVLNENLEIVDFLTLFSGQHRKYIIFGKNGSGKTTLINQLMHNFATSQIGIIPSNRIVQYNGVSGISNANASNKKLKNILSELTANPSPNDYLAYKLFEVDREEVYTKRDISTDEVRKGETIDSIQNIFNSLSTTRKLYIEGKSREIYLYRENDFKNKYIISKGSDGEKTIESILTYCMLLPRDSILFIDEPETHLNSALTVELFQEIEKKRGDLIYIFCTHNTNFVEKQKNSKIIYLKDYCNNRWVYDDTIDVENINPEIISEICGTKKDILFIEGDKNSIDFRIYSSLFNDKKIVPVKSCETVKNHCTKMSLFDNRKFYGVVDKDLKGKEEINALSSNSVYVLKYPEIENLTVCSYIIEKILSTQSAEQKEKILNIYNSKDSKRIILESYLRKAVKSISFEKLSIDDLNEKNIIEKSNLADLLSQIKKYTRDLDYYINTKDYNALISTFDLKAIKSSFKNYDEYIESVCEMIKKDVNFKEEIKRIAFYPLTTMQ